MDFSQWILCVLYYDSIVVMFLASHVIGTHLVYTTVLRAVGSVSKLIIGAGYVIFCQRLRNSNYVL